MRFLYLIIILAFGSCREKSVEGMWIEAHNTALLYFGRDSVKYNTLDVATFRETWGYSIANDSITFSGVRPELIEGDTTYSCKFSFHKDTLVLVRKGSVEGDKYVKSIFQNYKDYYLKSEGFKLDLPEARNIRQTTGFSPIDIKLGFVGNTIMLSVDGQKVIFSEFDSKIKEVCKSSDPHSCEARLFIDRDISMEYTWWILSYLRANEISQVNFIAETAAYDPYTKDFCGIRMRLPYSEINFIEK